MAFEPYGKDSELFNAVVNGDEKAIPLLNASLDDLQARFSLQEDHGMAFEEVTLLMIAAGSAYSNLETLNLLLEMGADPAATSQAGVTAAWYAAGGIPNAFLDKSIDRDEDGAWISQVGGDAARLERLLDAGADPNEPGWYGRCLLTEAAGTGRIDAVNLLLSRGADPLGRPDKECWSGGSGLTPVGSAAASGSAECVLALLEAGARLEGSVLAASADADMARLLIAKGAPMQFQDSWGMDMLDELFEEEKLDVARVLLEHGAQVEGVGWSSGWGTSRAGGLCGVNMNPRALKLVVEFGARTDGTGYSGGTLLHTAAWQGDGNGGRPVEDVRETLEFLISQGLPLDKTDNNGQTALHEAVHGDWDSPTSTEVLLRHGANPNIRDRNGMTALMIAAEWGALECVEILLEYKAGANIRNGWKTALSYAKDYLKRQTKSEKDQARGKPLFSDNLLEGMAAKLSEFGLDPKDTLEHVKSYKPDYRKELAIAQRIVGLLEAAMN